MVASKMRYRGFFLGAVVAVAASGAQAGPKYPNFSTSTAAFEPARPIAGDVVRYSFTVTNSGAASGYTRITTGFPFGFPIRFEGDCKQGSYDREFRKFLWHEGAFPAGTHKTCTVHMLTRLGASGTIATVTTEIFTPHLNLDAQSKADATGLPESHENPDVQTSYHSLEARPELESQPNASATRVGPVLVTPAGFVLLGFLALLGAGLAAVKRSARGGKDARTSTVANDPGLAVRAWAGVVIALGLLACLVAVGYGDWRANFRFHETRCTIVDSMIDAARSSRSKSITTYAPVFALRYDVEGRETFSSGFGANSRLTSGSREPSRRIIEYMVIGSEHPCWYDPDDPKVILLDRSLGGAYLFALLPLLGLGLAVFLLKGAMRRNPLRRVR
jgi:hypothetical protein